MLLDTTKEDLIKELGHDGSEILWPTYPDPIGRRAFSVQEAVDICERRGVALIEIQGNPAIVPMDKPDEMKLVFPDTFEERFNYYLNKYDGLLGAISPNKSGHCAAWNCKEQRVYDPTFGIATIEECGLAIQEFYAKWSR